MVADSSAARRVANSCDTVPQSVSNSRLIAQYDSNARNGWLGQLVVGRECKGRYKIPWVKGHHGFNGTDATRAQFVAMLRYADRQISSGDVDGIRALGARLPHGVLGIDVDAYDDKNGEATLSDWEAQYGPLPATYRVTARVDGVSGIRLYRVPPGFYPKETANSGVEFLDHHHRYLVAPPSWHHTGNRYRLYLPDGAPSPNGILPAIGSIPALPTSYLQGLEVRSTPAGRRGDATAAEVAFFGKRYNAGPQADLVPVVIRAAHRRNRESVRNAVRDALLWAMREVKGGRYGFENSVEQIQLWAITQYEKRGRTFDPEEFDRLVAYAVGQVADLSEDKLRAKWDRTVVAQQEGNDK